MSEVVYITGHKNPDSDSICSAVAYAELKKKLGIAAVPIRIGEVNRETEFALKYFGVEAPMYMDTMRTQLYDTIKFKSPTCTYTDQVAASKLARKAFHIEQDDKSIFLSGVVSRKKQIVPLLGSTLNNNIT